MNKKYSAVFYELDEKQLAELMLILRRNNWYKNITGFDREEENRAYYYIHVTLSLENMMQLSTMLKPIKFELEYTGRNSITTRNFR